MTNQSIALNANNDIFIDPVTGNLAMVSGNDAIAQDCKCAMQAQYGEMVFQPTDGLPNLTDVWISQHLVKWESAARNTLLSVIGVTSIVSFNYQLEGDTLSYQAVLQTIYSATLPVNDAITGAQNS